MNVKIRYKCPYCSRSIEHNPAYAGELVTCSACQGEFYEPTDPLPGRTAEKAPPRGASRGSKAPIPRSPVGYDAQAEKEKEAKSEKPADPKSDKKPATGAGPVFKEPKGSKTKTEDNAPLGGSLWAAVSDEPANKPAANKPAVKPPAKPAASASPGSPPGSNKPAATPGTPASSKTTTDAPPKSAWKSPPPTSSPSLVPPDDQDDEEIDFQAIIQSELSKPKVPPVGAKPPAGPPSQRPGQDAPKPAAPMARPAMTPPTGGAPMARPAAPMAGTPGAGLQSATPTEMANELRRRGLFAAIVFGDPSKPDQTQLALSDNMTRDDAKTFLMKLFGITKPQAEHPEGKQGGLFGRLFGGGKEGT